MTEIFSWAGPYCIAYEKIIPIMQNVIGLVQSGRRPELLLSPDVPLSIRSLIESGWDQNPDVRPTFRDITRVLEKAKADADYLSIHAPPLPTANPILMRDGRVYNIEQQQAGMVPIPQLQPLDNMIALQRTLPPQTAPLSASAPLLAGYAQQVPGGFNNSPVSPNYPPWQQQMAVPNGGVPAPYSLQQVGRSPSPSQQALYNNILNGGMVNSSAPLLNVVQPQSLVDRYGTSASPVKKGASMSNLGAQPSPGMGGPAIPQPVLRTMQQSDMLVRPHSQPSDVMMLPGSKHAVLWDVDETAGWFVMMGEPVEIVYKVKELQIDGKTLLALTERDMVEKLGITDFARRRRLGEMLDDYRMAGK
ncbi:hypothetical protein BC830DRAFT_467121 [Chytriomyces sp. MP71]|nr:hypothetical protein BC830DRAFT_467121 [Chytriomyces sp. MP71]